MTKHASVSFYRKCGKRGIDSSLAAILLVVLAPALLLVAVVVRLKIGSPVLFWQERPGYEGKPFWLCKFRTMTEDRDDGRNLLSDEQRLTKLGRILRQTSVDELPELWNVLRGQMSLVGPRPLLMKYLDRYTPTQARRHEVRPGLTGLAQINGRNALSWEERFELDVRYVDRFSFRLDCKILFTTFSKVLRCESVSAPGLATVAEFQGSHGQHAACTTHDVSDRAA